MWAKIRGRLTPQSILALVLMVGGMVWMLVGRFGIAEVHWPNLPAGVAGMGLVIMAVIFIRDKDSSI